MENFKEYIEKLRLSGLRPTRQRIMISKLLFGKSKETLHFTIEDLRKMVEKNLNHTISLATLYNTIHAFKKKGYVKEIALEGNKTYYDTNTSMHHHFYDEDTEELIDIRDSQISIHNIPDIPSGKSIKGVEVMVRVANNNHSQK